MDIGTIYGLATGLFAGGAAFGGAKVALNGTRRRVKDLKEEFIKHTEQDAANQVDAIDRLARIETKLDNLNNR